MRLLAAYYTHKPGGFCKRLYRLMNALCAENNEVHYYVLDFPPPALSSRVHVHLIPFPLRTRTGLLFWAIFTFWCPLYLIIAARRIRPDRFFAFGAYYAGMLGLARLFTPRPLILFLRSLVFRIDEINDKPQAIRWISNAVDRRGIRSATSVVCMTKTMQHEVEEFLGTKLSSVTILPNDIPTSAISQESTDEASLKLFERLNDELAGNKLIVLTSGVIDRRKNISYVIDAFETLQKNIGPGKALLLIAGDGPLLQEYKAEVFARRVPNIEFLGWCDSLEPLYPFVDLVVHPALHEGIPNSVLEALGAEVPVLCANTPEMLELFQSTDLLFEPARPQDLATKLQTIIGDPTEVLSSLWQRSEEVAKKLRFDWDAHAVQAVCRSID